MKIWICSLMLLACGTCLAGFGGVITGSGGDALICRAGPESPFEGTYSLDYVLTYDKDTTLVEVDSLKDSLKRISRLLEKKIPSLLPSFQRFQTYLFNNQDRTKVHFWESAEYGLVDLKDEKITNLLPENCRDGNDVKIVQAVIRLPPASTKAPEDHVIFKYVPKVVRDLSGKSPLQLSFLVVHEWLWEVTTDVEMIRRLNHFIHSQQFDDMSKSEVTDMLEGLGIQFNKDSKWFVPNAPEFREDICAARPEEMRDLIARENKSLGRANVYARSKYCDEDHGCRSLYSSMNHQMERMLKQPDVQIKMETFSDDISFLLDPHFINDISIGVDEKTATLKNETQQWTWTFDGNVSNSCLWMRMQRMVPVESVFDETKKSWWQEEIVIFLKLPPDHD